MQIIHHYDIELRAKHTHGLMFIRVKTPVKDDVDYESLGIAMPEDVEEEFVWVGVTPHISVRYLRPRKDGRTLIEFHDGDSIVVHHNPEQLIKAIMGSSEPRKISIHEPDSD